MDHYAKLVVGGLLALASFGASAQVDWSSQFIRDHATRVINGTKGPVNVGSAFGSMTINSGTGGALVQVKQPLNIGGTGTTLTLTRALSPAAVAKVAARAALRFGPAAIVGTAIELAWNEATKQWEVPGGPASDIWRELSSPEGLGCGLSYGNHFYAEPDGEFTLVVRKGSEVHACGQAPLPHEGRETLGYCPRYNENNQIECYDAIYRWRNMPDVPGPTISEPTPASPQQVEDAIAQDLAKPGQFSRAAGWLESAIDLLGSLGRQLVDELAGPTQVSGPTTVAGPTTTSQTQTPQGTETTTTTVNHNLTYADNSVTINSTTTITHADGSVTTETTTINEGDAVPPDTGLCDRYPEIVACQKLGEIEPVELENRVVPLTMSPDTGWGPSDAACPADVSFNWQGQPLAMSWQPFCSFATGVRPVVIAIAYLSAILVFFGLSRKD